MQEPLKMKIYHCPVEGVCHLRCYFLFASLETTISRSNYLPNSSPKVSLSLLCLFFKMVNMPLFVTLYKILAKLT